MPRRDPLDTSPIASVERALEVLDAFEAGPGSLTLTELSERTGLYKSTILRIAETLATRGYLVKEFDGTYQIGPKPFRLGARYQSSVIPTEWVLPVLRDLVTATRESAAFNVRYGEHRVCLLRVDSPHLIRDHTQPGDIRPLGRGAAGKLMLAFDQLQDPQFDAARRELILHSYGEIEADMAGIAVPVFGADGRLRGVLTVSGPSGRFTKTAVKGIEEALWSAAISLTARIGGDVARFETARRAAKKPGRASAQR
ncbi:MAG: IclR family transcriptional regulator [Burkholderiales bacterium]|nr:IclR family transcriptional regulator [Burkholderiales bacterium]